ncbi:MAG: hypothetical protein IJY38_01630 [Clostridia bacterium]|nr:hypothetical protein [Clostridia bacterium]
MKSFKDYHGASEEEKLKEMAASAEKESAAEELTRKIAAAYSGKSSGDMMMSILRQAEESKRCGTLTNEEIDEFYQTFSPMLDGVQKRRLKQIVERLKSI